MSRVSDVQRSTILIAHRVEETRPRHFLPCASCMQHRPLKAFIIVMTALLLVVGLSRVLLPHDFDQTSQLWSVNDLLLAGKNPWNTAAVLGSPYVIASYGPAFHAVSAIGQALFGDQLWYLRLLSMLSYLVIGCSVWFLARVRFAERDTTLADRSIVSTLRANVSGPVALLSLWCSQVVISGISVGRPDAIGLCFTVTGMALLLGTPRRTLPLQVAMAGVLLGLAPLFKQTYLSGVVVGLFCAWRMGCLKYFVATALGLPVAITSALVIATNGGFIDVGLRYPMLPEQTTRHGLEVAVTTFLGSPAQALLLGTLLATVAILVVAMRWSALARTRLSVAGQGLILWWVIAAELAFTASRRLLGGSPGYWLEFITVTSVLLGQAISQAYVAWPRFDQRRTLLMRWAGAMFLAGLLFGLRSLRGQYFEWEAQPYIREITRIVAEQTPPDQPALSYFSEVPRRAGRQVVFNDLLLFQHTTEQNRELLRRYVRSRTPACLVLQPETARAYLTADYVEAPTRNPFPSRTYAAKVYIRRDLLPQEPWEN